MTWDGGSPELPPLWGPAMERDLGPARGDGPLEPHHQNVAASLQRRLEEVILGMLRQLHERTGIDDLCLAGGVALNCVVNGKIFDETPFRRVYIQPAAYDGGTSVGAAYHVWHQVLGRPRGFVMDHAYWGPEFGDARLKQALEDAGVAYAELPEPEILSRTADALADGKIVGWYQGRMEFGPRALGNRSILTDPRRAEMKDILNARIKHREPFRPFAPVVLEEATGDYFTKDHPSPFMLMTYPVRPDKIDEIPAPTHVDGTGRLQTVRRDQNPRYYGLIDAFRERTGVPVLLNTSFNENEPICCTPEEAVETFRRTKMDVLVLGDRFVEKLDGRPGRTGSMTTASPDRRVVQGAAPAADPRPQPVLPSRSLGDEPAPDRALRGPRARPRRHGRDRASELRPRVSRQLSGARVEGASSSCQGGSGVVHAVRSKRRDGRARLELRDLPRQLAAGGPPRRPPGHRARAHRPTTDRTDRTRTREALAGPLRLGEQGRVPRGGGRPRSSLRSASDRRPQTPVPGAVPQRGPRRLDRPGHGRSAARTRRAPIIASRRSTTGQMGRSSGPSTGRPCSGPSGGGTTGSS